MFFTAPEPAATVLFSVFLSAALSFLSDDVSFLSFVSADFVPVDESEKSYVPSLCGALFIL